MLIPEMRVESEHDISCTAENSKGSVAKVSKQNIYDSPDTQCLCVNYEEISVEWA